jgi:5-methylcytosine-specific restriction protein A
VEAGQSYCEKHKKHKPINTNTRSSCADGYDRRWQRLRAYKLRLNPLCETCLVNGIVTAAEEVDHIKPVRDYPELRLVLDNLQSMCKSCHSRKTRKENKK